MTEAAEKKDVQKLQRSIVDSLEDVKAQDIVVLNTEHLSSLFERVVIASGDGRFANCAEILTEQGVEVMVVARHESLSRRLSAAASSVIFLPE